MELAEGSSEDPFSEKIEQLKEVCANKSYEGQHPYYLDKNKRISHFLQSETI